MTRSSDDQLTDGVADLQQLVHTEATSIAGVGAHVASGALEPDRWLVADLLVDHPHLGGCRDVRRRAAGADATQQALPDHAAQGRRHQERLDAHVGEPVHRSDGIDRVQRRQHQVAGQRGLHRDARRVLVTDLAHEDDVGVLAKNPAQTVGERHPGVTHRHLGDPVELVLDRVLDGHHVAGRIVDLRERGVERRGLARPGRAGAEQHAQGRLDDLQIGRLDRRVHPQVLQGDQRLGLVQQPQHDLLAMDGRHRRDADVDGSSVDRDAELAVLGPATLDDVQVGHHLDATGERRCHPRRQLDRFGHGTVHAVADAHVILGGLDVDVRRPTPHSLGDHPVHHLDDRGVVVDLERGLGVPCQVVGIGELEGLDDGLRLGEHVVGLVEQSLDLTACAHHEPDAPTPSGQLVDGLGVEGVCDRHEDALVLDAQRDDRVLASELLTDELGCFRLGGLLSEVRQGNPELLRQSSSERRLVDGAHLEQHLAQLRGTFGGRVLLLVLQRLDELIGIDRPQLQHDLAQLRPIVSDPAVDLRGEHHCIAAVEVDRVAAARRPRPPSHSFCLRLPEHRQRSSSLCAEPPRHCCAPLHLDDQGETASARTSHESTKRSYLAHGYNPQHPRPAHPTIESGSGRDVERSQRRV